MNRYVSVDERVNISEVSDRILTAILNSATVAGSFSFLLFRDGGYIMAAHPLGWQTLFGAVPTTADASRQLIQSTVADLRAVTDAMAKQVVSTSRATHDDSAVLRFSKILIGVEGIHYVAAAVPVFGTPFSLVSFAPYKAPGTTDCSLLLSLCTHCG